MNISKFLVLVISAAVVLMGAGCVNSAKTTANTNAVVASSGNNVITGLTMVEVAKHNSATSCYTVVDGSVYNLTNWISKHPGGEKAIKGLCGKDGTQAFQNKHDGQEKPKNTIISFKIGALVK